MGQNIAIAITTFNRSKQIIKTVNAFKRLSSIPHTMIICDDGSTDDTLNALRNEDCIVISGKNKGIAWNKNRGLLYANMFCDYDCILLCDDDVFPDTYGWEFEWLEACKLYGHVTKTYDVVPLSYGKGTAERIGLANKVAGQVLAFRRDIITSLGYFDTRFGKYGHEHTDLTNRSIRLGYGGMSVEGGERYYCVIHGGFGMVQLPSAGSAEDAALNYDTFKKASSDQIFRPAWRTDAEMNILLSEVNSARGGTRAAKPASTFNEKAYLAANPDVERANVHPLQHYVLNGRREGRKLAP